jgi:hypothetical protein
MPSPAHLDLVVAHVHVFAAADNVAVRQRARQGGRVDAQKGGDEFDLCGFAYSDEEDYCRGQCAKKYFEKIT